MSVKFASAIYVSAPCACWPVLHDRMSALQHHKQHSQSYSVLLLCHAHMPAARRQAAISAVLITIHHTLRLCGLCSGHRLRLTVSEMWCQQACFDRPKVWGWPNRRGRVPAIDLSRIAVQQHPARLTIPRSFNGNLAVRELECTYDGSSHRPCLILTPNRIQFRTRETLCAQTHICWLR